MCAQANAHSEYATRMEINVFTQDWGNGQKCTCPTDFPKPFLTFTIKEHNLKRVNLTTRVISTLLYLISSV